MQPNINVHTKWRNKHLAVPSDGSNPMQHVVGAVVAGSWFTCSTLRRVEPYATKDRCTISGYTPTLQYPQTGRTLCNYSDMGKQIDASTILQYPQTGRTLCNTAAACRYTRFAR